MTTGGPYSGFWVRLGALLIDWIIVSVLGGAVGLVLGIPLIGALAVTALPGSEETGELTDEAAAALALTALLGVLLIVGAVVLVQYLYFVLLTGLRGQTLGKMVAGIRVVDGQGQVPGIGRAFMREVIGKFVSGLVVYLGFLWVAWDQEKQGWHDKIAGTHVVPA